MRRIKLAIVLVVLLCLAVLICIPAREMFALRAVQAAAGPNCTMTVTFHPSPVMDHAFVKRWLKPNTPWGRSVRYLHLYDAAPFRGDLGAALMRLPRLDYVVVTENENKGHASGAEWACFISTLAAHPTLEGFYLNARELSDAMLAPLAGHPRLNRVGLEGDRITPACLQRLEAMPKLTILALDRISASEDEWMQYTAGIRKLPQLVILMLSGDHLTDAALAQLAGHPALGNITVFNHRLTPQSITTFARMPGLHVVQIGGPSPAFAKEDIAALRAALPSATVTFDREKGAPK